MTTKIQKMNLVALKKPVAVVPANKFYLVPVFSCRFEVFGRVQGVNFRRCAERKARALGVTGWILNTKLGTVKGLLEGTLEQVTDMKYWLRYTGSRSSLVQAVFFSENEPRRRHNFRTFSIRY